MNAENKVSKTHYRSKVGELGMKSRPYDVGRRLQYLRSKRIDGGNNRLMSPTIDQHDEIVYLRRIASRQQKAIARGEKPWMKGGEV